MRKITICLFVALSFAMSLFGQSSYAVLYMDTSHIVADDISANYQPLGCHLLPVKQSIARVLKITAIGDYSIPAYRISAGTFPASIVLSLRLSIGANSYAVESSAIPSVSQGRWKVEFWVLDSNAQDDSISLVRNELIISINDNAYPDTPAPNLIFTNITTKHQGAEIGGVVGVGLSARFSNCGLDPNVITETMLMVEQIEYSPASVLILSNSVAPKEVKGPKPTRGN